MSRTYRSEIYSVINRLPDNEISNQKTKTLLDRKKKKEISIFFIVLFQLDESSRKCLLNNLDYFLYFCEY